VEVAAPVERGVGSPRVAAIIVTWNRHAAVDVVLRALTRQEFPRERLDVVVVDNASTDGTASFLAERWRPEAVVENPTLAADEPAFSGGPRPERHAPGRNGTAGHPETRHPGNAGGFASLTVVRNAQNLGGCGGFNTGLAFVDRYLDSPTNPLAYVWLVDDDVDLPESALEQLVRTAEGDPAIGLVGSRTMDFADRSNTIETTIYFDSENGWMGPDPMPAHPRHEEHRRWAEAVGGTRGRLPFAGVRDVDVVSACSLLARWEAVKKVGFWDARYFIYCDDADWCLRFARSGYRVVVDLDALVYHTYWLSKITPVRAYYSQRNLIWLIQKALDGRRLRRATMRRLGALLLDSRKAMTHCRLFHAEIIRRTAHDVCANRGGRLDDEGPAAEPLLNAFDRAGALRGDATVLVMCSHHESIAWADELHLRLRYALIDAGRAADLPRLVYMVREGVPDPAVGGSIVHPHPHPRRIVFAPNRGSKWRANRPFLRRPPDAVVIFDQHNDFPLLRSRANIHIDRRRPGLAQCEPDGLGRRAAFLWRWLRTAARCAAYAVTVKPYVRTGRYG
jgi:GT2 family glycosyltransferase